MTGSRNGDDNGYDDGDGCSVFEVASRISPVQENTGIILQLAHHTWTMCQTNCKSFLHYFNYLRKYCFCSKSNGYH